MLAQTAPLALTERRQDADGGVKPRQHVHDRHPDLDGWAVRLAGDAHQPAQPLKRGVVAGFCRARPGLSETGDRGVHEARVGC